MTVFMADDLVGKIDSILSEASQGEDVRILSREGLEFVLRPTFRSGLDVPPLNLPITADEIVAIVREGRERQY